MQRERERENVCSRKNVKGREAMRDEPSKWVKERERVISYERVLEVKVGVIERVRVMREECVCVCV